MLFSAGALVMFVVLYQKRLLQQQLLQRSAEATYQQQLVAAIVEAQERERERIGRDLHDGIGSSVAAAKMLISRILTNGGSGDSSNLLVLVDEVITSAAQEVRNVSHTLYPAVLSRFGLAAALQYLVDICNEMGTLAIEIEIDYPRPVPLAQELALYRICQELINNALKHAEGATRLRIELLHRGTLLTLSVADNGCGFSTDMLGGVGAQAANAGVGLRSIAVRVQMLQAKLHHHSVPGQGSRIAVELQVPELVQQAQAAG